MKVKWICCLFLMFLNCSQDFKLFAEKEIEILKDKVKTLEQKRNVTLVKDVAQLTLHVILISGILYFIYQSYLRKD